MPLVRLPNAMMAGAVWRSATQCAPTGAPAANNSSTTMKRSTGLRPEPPKPAGMAMPTQPRAASLRENSGECSALMPSPGR